MPYMIAERLHPGMDGHCLCMVNSAGSGFVAAIRINAGAEGLAEARRLGSAGP